MRNVGSVTYARAVSGLMLAVASVILAFVLSWWPALIFAAIYLVFGLVMLKNWKAEPETESPPRKEV